METVDNRHKTIIIMILFCAAYVPYCTSDAYTGTRAPSEASEGLAFYGKHVFTALVADLLENTWVSQAEEASAGRFIRASSALRRLCSADSPPARSGRRPTATCWRTPCTPSTPTSGSGASWTAAASTPSTRTGIYTLFTHYLHIIYRISTQYLRSAECATQDLLLSWFQAWEGINDESCLAEHPAGERGCVRCLLCISAAVSNTYLVQIVQHDHGLPLYLHPLPDPPQLHGLDSQVLHCIVSYCIIALLHCFGRYCYDDTTEFWQQWQAELAGVAREIAAARPEFGVDILSCPFHGAVNWAWDYLEVATQHHTIHIRLY